MLTHIIRTSTEDFKAESNWPQRVIQIHMNKQRALDEVILLIIKDNADYFFSFFS